MRLMDDGGGDPTVLEPVADARRHARTAAQRLRHVTQSNRLAVYLTPEEFDWALLL